MESLNLGAVVDSYVKAILVMTSIKFKKMENISCYVLENEQN